MLELDSCVRTHAFEHVQWLYLQQVAWNIYQNTRGLINSIVVLKQHVSTLAASLHVSLCSISTIDAFRFLFKVAVFTGASAYQSTSAVLLHAFIYNICRVAPCSKDICIKAALCCKLPACDLLVDFCISTEYQGLSASLFGVKVWARIETDCPASIYLVCSLEYSHEHQPMSRSQLNNLDLL